MMKTRAAGAELHGLKGWLIHLGQKNFDNKITLCALVANLKCTTVAKTWDLKKRTNNLHIKLLDLMYREEMVSLIILWFASMAQSTITHGCIKTWFDITNGPLVRFKCEGTLLYDLMSSQERRSRKGSRRHTSLVVGLFKVQ